jgi:hypothetical protein
VTAGEIETVLADWPPQVVLRAAATLMRARAARQPALLTEVGPAATSLEFLAREAVAEQDLYGEDEFIGLWETAAADTGGGEAS